MMRSSRLGYVMLAITASLLAVMNLRSSVFSVVGTAAAWFPDQLRRNRSSRSSRPRESTQLAVYRLF